MKLRREISSQVRRGFELSECHPRVLFLVDGITGCGAVEHLSLAIWHWQIEINAYVTAVGGSIP